MGKEVQKTTRSTNLDFDIFMHIVKGSYPSKIAKELGISKSNVNYYISSLKERKLIEMRGRGAWIAVKNYSPRRYKKTTRVARKQLRQGLYLNDFDPNTIRAHAFQFKLQLPRDILNWTNEKREELFKKSKIRFQPLKHLFGGGQRIKFRGRKIHITNKSIIIYEKASYFATTSKQAQTTAMIKILYLIKALERKLRANNAFSINGKYKVKVTKQHFALIKNSLASIYNEPTRKKLEVHNEKGLWLLIDNSFNLDELEAVHSLDAPTDSQGIKDYLNSHERTGFKVTPEFVVDSIAKTHLDVQQFTKAGAEYGVNIQTHIGAIKQLGDAITELTKLIAEKKK